MNKEYLKEIMLDQKEVFLKDRHLVERDIHLEPYIHTSQVVVISGVRRCGKSSLLFLLKEKMKLSEGDFCYFNFDDERIMRKVEVLEQIDNLHNELYNKEAILFFDEIQNIPGWEKFVNRIYEQGRKVFVTGSNASLLSSEISTSLTGRNKPLNLFPFSFNEYLRFKQLSFDIHFVSTKDKTRIIRALNEYISTGGFPLVLKENDLELLNAYFQDILYRDIISRYKLTKTEEIKQIALYFFSNIARKFSYKNLQQITGTKSTSSIKDYLHYYSQAFLFYYVQKFDYSVKKQVLNPKKVYTVDHGFVHRIGFNFSANKGWALENIVFLELIRQNKEVFYYSGRGECDFVVKQGTGITQVVQVTYNLTRDNYDREINGLQEAISRYNLPEGLLLVYFSEIEPGEIPKNIEIVPVWKWLMAPGS